MKVIMVLAAILMMVLFAAWAIGRAFRIVIDEQERLYEFPVHDICRRRRP